MSAFGDALDEFEPPYDDPSQQPKTLTKSGHKHNGKVLYVAGRLPVDESPTSDIMFITTSVDEDEATTRSKSLLGFSISQPAEYLKGPTGVLKDVALRAGLDMDKCYYTALCKWLLPRVKRNAPPVKVCKWGLPVLMDEIERVKPKIIVCLGKQPFDLLSDRKLNFKDAHGGWFWSSEANCHLYLMNTPWSLIAKPEMYEMFRVDFAEIQRKHQLLLGNDIVELPVRGEIIDNENDLVDWVQRRIEAEQWLYCVDGEWHGRTHVDGQLRTFQFAWTESDAMLLEFRDEKNVFSFEFNRETTNRLCEEAERVCFGGKDDLFQEALEKLKYLEIGNILKPLLHRPEVRYIGHHISADWPWMVCTLGIDVWGRCVMDTEFAQQAVDEASELGLERGIGMKYTTLGLYNLELVLWKKDNKKLCEDGYGFIPKEILYPYACLAWDSMVQLGDGSWEKIHKLVQSKYTGTVKALVDGSVRNCTVTNWKKSKKPGQKWFRIVTPTTRGCGKGGKQPGKSKGYAGPRFTEDHKILTNFGYVRVDELIPGKHAITTADRELTGEQRQIVLGSMLGDGGLSQRNDAGYSFRFSQSGHRIPYAQWKAECLGNVMTFNTDLRPAKGNTAAHINFTSRHHVAVSNLAQRYSRAPGSGRGHFEITEQLLEDAGDLGLAVWLMDDATKVGHTIKLHRTSATKSEVAAGLAYFKRRFGQGVRHYPSNGIFVFSDGAYWRLMDAVKPYFHPSMSYKHAEGSDITAPYVIDQEDRGPVCEAIEKVVPADRKGGNKKMECFRYCLTVPEAGNFLTKVGFVSNCRDVIAPFRAYPIILKQLDYQQLLHYHNTILVPFISDVFSDFAITGLPMDIPLMDELRELFHFAKGVLEEEFRKTMGTRATSVLRCALVNELGMMNGIAMTKAIQGKDFHETLDMLKGVIDLKNVGKWIKLLEHYYDAPNFNIRSPDQMRRWLFDVEKLTPIKSTNQKAKGLPSQSWEKVLELPEDRQKVFTPAVDKQTLQILAQQCAEINELLDLNVVGNLCKAFLKEAEEYYDEDLDEWVVDEHGLHQWLASDGRIHGQMSLTGTGRPRSWMPNTLNWPSYVNERIGRAVIRAIQLAHANGTLPESLLKWVLIKDEKELPSIRSCVTAPEGMILVESDYATAEMVALAKISGDRDLQRILEEPDPEWAELKPGNALGAKYVRVRYLPEVETGIPKHKHKEEYLMAVWKDGDFVGKVTEDDLARNADGSVKHRGYDIHWSIAERIYERPREEMIEKIYRNAAKVINFSSAYGASPASLERKIESDTGVKPEEGVGQKGLDAIRLRQPRSTEFLEEMAEVPKKRGYYRAASGRICHCVTHSAGSGVGWRQRNATESALGREMRNFPMQESVASTAARAGRMLRRLYLKLGLKAKPITILYDSVVTLCPLEERFIVAKLHTLCMSELNTWDYNDELSGKRTLKYSVDNEFNYRWSTRPSKAIQKVLDDPEFHPTPDRLKWTLAYENWHLLVS